MLIARVFEVRSDQAKFDKRVVYLFIFLEIGQRLID